MQSDNAIRLIPRLREGLENKRDLLVYENGKIIEADDCADAWKRLQSFMLSATLLKGYRLGNRHIVPRITLVIQKWGNLIPLTFFGYNPKLRMARLERNYLNLESLDVCKAYFEKRAINKPSTHGISFGTGRKKTPPCMVGGTFFWGPGRTFCDFYIRASEVTKTLAADFHFLDRVIHQGPLPEYMSENLGSVRIHLSMAYVLAQWFPLIDMIMPGYPMNGDHKFHRMCLRSLALARNIDGYQSKWKPERRIHNYYRKNINDYKTNNEGRIVQGPSFFPLPKKHLSQG